MLNWPVRLPRSQPPGRQPAPEHEPFLTLLQHSRGDLLRNIGLAAICTHLGRHIREHQDRLAPFEGCRCVTCLALSMLTNHTRHHRLLSEKPGPHRSKPGSHTVMTIISSPSRLSVTTTCMGRAPRYARTRRRSSPGLVDNGLSKDGRGSALAHHAHGAHPGQHMLHRASKALVGGPELSA